MGREKAGRTSGFGLFAVNCTTRLIKDFSSSPVSIHREKRIERERCGKGEMKGFCACRGRYFDRMGDGD